MAFDPDAEPWRTARRFLEDFGDGAEAAVWRHSEMLANEGQPDDARIMLPVLLAVLALGPRVDPAATVH